MHTLRRGGKRDKEMRVNREEGEEEGHAWEGWEETTGARRDPRGRGRLGGRRGRPHGGQRDRLGVTVCKWATRCAHQKKTQKGRESKKKGTLLIARTRTVAKNEQCLIIAFSETLKNPQVFSVD